ncbi:MAG: hypothetical protein Q8R40_01125 [bacterium]|nr:hypothetical protein [bacterium]
MNAELKTEIRYELTDKDELTAPVEEHICRVLTVLYFEGEDVCIADSKGNMIGVLALEEPNDGSNFKVARQHPLLHFYFKPGIDVKLEKMEVDYLPPSSL